MLFVNGKEADKLTEEDIIALINNDDYMENQYIDYKQQFAFWDERLPRENRKQEVIEFKKDVCSFANAEGGYIFVGISEKNGLPNEIIGVEIKDKDKYELDIREKLSNIQPKTPSVKVHFIELKNKKYIIVLEVIADYFAPYVYNSGNDAFDFVYRFGNGKQRMSYNQVMRMFNQSLIVQKEIMSFRQGRVELYSKSKKIPLYCRAYVISQDFLDVASHKKIYMMYRNNCTLISCPSGFSFISPNVDGIKFLAYGDNIGKDAYLFNNGICEFNFEFNEGSYLHNKNNQWHLSSLAIWDDMILKCIKYSIEHLIKLGYSRKAYICFDLACYEGTITDGSDYHNPKMDRDLIMSSVIEISDISNNEILNEAVRNLNYEYYMALGIRDNDKYEEIENITYF